MPLKWKIFLALNFIVALPAFVLLLLLIIGLANNSNHSEDYLWGSVFGAGLLFVGLNSFLNIILVQRYYPDKLIPPPVKTTHIILLVLSALTTIGMIILCVYAAMWEFSDNNEGRDFTGKIMLGILILALIIETITLIMQVGLPALINRNNRKKMDSLINAIGQ
ncbi:MAG: hypothetical protein JNN00_01720 [Chitinophagaceae bacterium]|nr:hypothetical protein [Chitinophagaceae bacterium]